MKTYYIRDDLTGEAIPDGNQAKIKVTVGLKVWVLDVDKENPIVQQAMQNGKQSARAGRRPYKNA